LYLSAYTLPVARSDAVKRRTVNTEQKKRKQLTENPRSEESIARQCNSVRICHAAGYSTKKLASRLDAAICHTSSL